MTKDGEPLQNSLLLENVLSRLRKVIASLPAGSKLPTIRQLTAQFSVSQHVLQQAMRQLRAENLVSSHVGRGTFVGQVAASADNRNRRVLTLLYQHRYQRGDIVARNIHQRLSIDGHQSLILTYSNVSDVIDMLQGGMHFDTCIVQPRASPIPVSLISLLKQRADNVLIEAYAGEQLDVDSVSNDPEATVRLIVEHLGSLGHRRIAWLTEDIGNYFFERTAQLFSMYCLGAGLSPHECPIVRAPADPEMLGLSDIAGELRKLKGDRDSLPVSAVVVASFSDGASIIKAFRELGMEIPRDIAVVRMGSPDLASDHMDTISIVGRTSRQAADTVLERVFWRWENPDAPYRPYFDTPVLVRF
jgi:DNA-binding LacI/PurR family transcriptional regulator